MNPPHVTGVASVTSILGSRPPYAPADRTVRGAEVQGTLALDLTARPDAPRPQLRAVTGSREELEAFARRFSAAVVEVLAGDRGPAQLVRCTTDAVYDDLVHRSRVLAGPGASDQRLRRVRAVVRSVHVFCPAPDAAEFSLHVRHGQRSRAVAGRLELRDRGWTCVALQFG